MRLILTRHGQTEDNIKGILQGQNHGKLSQLGIEQAKKLALRLKTEKIDAIFSSDLKRAADTAEEIHKFHKNIPLILEKDLREGNLGDFVGKESSKVNWDKMPNNAETLEDMQKRVVSLLDRIYKKYKDKTVLFVAHQGINKALILHILSKPLEEIDKLGKFQNTSVSIFEIREDKKHIVHLMNCSKHLQE